MSDEAQESAPKDSAPKENAPKDSASKKRIVRARPIVASVTDAPKAPPLPESAPALAAPPVAASPVPETSPAPAVRAPGSDAALAQAVASARKDGPRPSAPEKPRAASPLQRLRSIAGHPYAQAAAVVLALGGGFMGAQAYMASAPAAKSASVQMAEAAQSLARSQQDVLRLAGDLKALKVAVESLKESVDRTKSDVSGKQGQILERIDRSDRSHGDGAARFAKLAEQLDRVEAAAKEPGAKLGALNERLERLERQITTLQSAAAKPASAAPEPVQTGTVDPKPAKDPVKDSAKDASLDGWTLHEVYDGVALIEGRNRRLYEVAVGGTIPGVGPVESIERRNKRWVVVTPKGIIGG